MSKWTTARSTLDVAATLAVLVAAAVFVSTRLGLVAPIAPSSGESLHESGEIPRMVALNGSWLDASALRNSRGDSDTVLIEFGDFECSFCRRMAQEAYPRIDAALVQKGVVRFAFVNYPLEQIHPSAFQASMAAECAGRQGYFWEMHDRLFEGLPRLGIGDLVTHGASVSLDGNRFEACLNGEATEAVISDINLGRRLGIRGTPAFVIGKERADGRIELLVRIDGAHSFAALAAAIQEVRGLDDLELGR